MPFFFSCCYVFDEILLIILVHRSMSSTSLLSSLDCVADDNGAFDPIFAIDYNRYAQDDDTDVIRIELCQTEGRFGCEDDIANGRAYVVRHPDYVWITSGDDVAVIFLTVEQGQQVADIPNVALNCNPSVPAVGQDLEAFGCWGSTDFPHPGQSN